MPGVSEPTSSEYPGFVRRLLGSHDRDRAMALAVGGSFEAIGICERELLVHHGLETGQTVVDVGCGSGRLAVALADHLDGRFIGIDVATDLVDHAREAAGRPDWDFVTTDGSPTIPADDASADWVCFFSVVTHLPHGHSYRYLEDARRVVRPGGRVVVSFLEHGVDAHWPTFVGNLDPGDGPPVVFLEHSALQVWARHLGLDEAFYVPGGEAHIPIPRPLTFDDGTTVTERAALGPIGQSVAILVRPAADDRY